MIILVIDSPSMIGRTILETLMAVDKKVLVVSASDKNELPNDYIIDDFIKSIHELSLIQRFDDLILTQNEYEYLDIDIPIHYFIPIKIVVIDILINVEAFNPNTPIRGTPIVHYN